MAPTQPDHHDRFAPPGPHSAAEAPHPRSPHAPSPAPQYSQSQYSQSQYSPAPTPAPQPQGVGVGAGRGGRLGGGAMMTSRLLYLLGLLVPALAAFLSAVVRGIQFTQDGPGAVGMGMVILTVGFSILGTVALVVAMLLTPRGTWATRIPAAVAVVIALAVEMVWSTVIIPAIVSSSSGSVGTVGLVLAIGGAFATAFVLALVLAAWQYANARPWWMWVSAAGAAVVFALVYAGLSGLLGVMAGAVPGSGGFVFHTVGLQVVDLVLLVLVVVGMSLLARRADAGALATGAGRSGTGVTDGAASGGSTNGRVPPPLAPPVSPQG
ncbi:hypothetical protein [Brevibacterium litoralis]|uniref:hypothetical protein n=1 Tax=Brevibacterium litoralis TaxID=3138935 RepID=UPI0032ED88F8